MASDLMTKQVEERDRNDVLRDIAARRLLDAVVADPSDRKAGALLRRRLLVDERQMLSRRIYILNPYLIAAQPAHIGKIISTMLRMFKVGGSASSKEDVQVTIAAYVSALKNFPLWIIERTAHRFVAGTVTADELGSDQQLSLGFPPTTAQFCVVARKVVEPIKSEASRIDMALRGTVEERTAADQTPEERAAMAAKFAELQETLQRNSKTDTEVEAEKVAQQKRLEESGARTQRNIIAEYHALGLNPVVNGSGIVHSLPLLRTLGWTIQTIDGEPTLVAPPPEKRRKPPADRFDHGERE